MQATFDYGYANVRDLQINGTRATSTGKVNVTGISINGEAATPTKRFWRSFFTRFGIADNVFRYFDPAEVFERISERAADDTFRYCLERGAKGKNRLLAVSSPKRPVIRFDEVAGLVKRYDGEDIKYESGIVTSTHRPRSGDRTFEIGGDQFQHRFVMETPVDGFSHPKIYLSFLRLICSNGAIGYTRAFRSDISMGKDIGHCIARALDSYDNGDGYAALRQRFESSQNSWASVHECMKLYKALIKLNDENQTKSAITRDFYQMTGNLNSLYGLANLDALSVKRQRVLPAQCRVYDLINFASEVATHHASAAGNRTMQAYIGSMISDEYDMEGTAESANEFSDFFVADATAGPAPSLN